MQQKDTSQSRIESFRADLRFFTRAVDQMDKIACANDVNVPQCHTIMEIGLSGPISVNALADNMNLDKSTVSRQVENLVKSKLVQRITALTDRRKVEISLSHRGSRVYKRMNTSMNTYFESVFEEVPEEELAVFLRVFNKISHSL